MVLRFLHLSDIHFGQEKDGTLMRWSSPGIQDGMSFLG